jgi:hypothetical protein
LFEKSKMATIKKKIWPEFFEEVQSLRVGRVRVGRVSRVGRATSDRIRATSDRIALSPLFTEQRRFFGLDYPLNLSLS